MREFKGQRIRDPLHNIVDFGANEFEDVLWRVIQTYPFQRLRRVRQLGFSEFVYPGATHSRFAHSIGVFHIARQLMSVIERHLRRENHYLESKAHRALAASLVHDLGHGPFSHAFESVGKRFGFSTASHENLSTELIRNSEVTEVLDEIGTGFANDVADIVSRKVPRHIYDTVVSSQFDADRLDYMRRDRMMTGTQHSAIDFQWLLANLEVGVVKTGVDDKQLTSEVETLVLGPKAVFAAEAYILGLFQLYPTVYFHKTTRGLEKLFTELLARVVQLTIDGSSRLLGLQAKHPLLVFAKNPDSSSSLLELDDSVIWGALPMLEYAKDEHISKISSALRKRDTLKCYDVLDRLETCFQILVRATPEKRAIKTRIVEEACEKIRQEVSNWNSKHKGTPPKVLIDEGRRSPYNQLQESEGPLNQILIKVSKHTQPVDLGIRSSVVAAIEAFYFFRLYFSRLDDESGNFVEKLIQREASRAAKKWNNS